MNIGIRIVISGTLSMVAATGFAAKFGDDGFTWKEKNVQGSTTSYDRCIDDQIIEPEHAKKRAAWAYKCKILDEGIWDQMFTSRWDPTKKGMTRLPESERRYPIFIVNTAGQPIWEPNLKSCAVPDNVVFYDVCKIGCYRGDQRISFEHGYEPIASAEERGADKSKVLTIDPEKSSFENPVFKASKIEYFTKNSKDANEVLVTLTTKDGRLTVTKNHPLVNDEGYMVTADTLEVGENLVLADGSPSTITEKTYENFYGKVYNISPLSDNPVENVIVAEGFLNGSHSFQDGLMAGFDGVVLKRNIDFK